jgi:hypothetical protein
MHRSNSSLATGGFSRRTQFHTVRYLLFEIFYVVFLIKLKNCVCLCGICVLSPSTVYIEFVFLFSNNFACGTNELDERGVWNCKGHAAKLRPLQTGMHLSLFPKTVSNYKHSQHLDPTSQSLPSHCAVNVVFSTRHFRFIFYWIKWAVIHFLSFF